MTVLISWLIAIHQVYQTIRASVTVFSLEELVFEIITVLLGHLRSSKAPYDVIFSLPTCLARSIEVSLAAFEAHR